MNNTFQEYMTQMFKYAQNPFGFNSFFNQGNPIDNLKQMNEKVMEEKKKYYDKFSSVCPDFFKNENGEIKPVNEQVMGLVQMFEQVCSMEQQKQNLENLTEMYKKGLQEQYEMMANLMPKKDENGNIVKPNFEEVFNKFKEAIPFKNDNCNLKETFMKMNPGLELMENKFKELKNKTGEKLPFGIPVQLVQVLMQIESSPEKLNMLQKFLDFIFNEYEKRTTTKEDQASEK